MTAVEKYLFTPLFYPRNNLDVLKWWESRRLLYNGVVGGAGLLTLATLALFEPGPPLMFLAFAVVYGTLANLGFCLGPVADLALRRVLGPGGHAVGPVLFRYGFAFAVALTLLPIPLIILSQLLRFVF